MAQERWQERWKHLVEQLRQAPGIVAQLPEPQGAVARAAVDGQSVHEIAQAHQLAEEAVWAMVGGVVRAATGQVPAQPVETGGLGSDTDPGVTGGYGETAFGSLGNEPPVPLPGEPLEPSQPESPLPEDVPGELPEVEEDSE